MIDATPEPAPSGDTPLVDRLRHRKVRITDGSLHRVPLWIARNEPTPTNPLPAWRIRIAPAKVKQSVGDRGGSPAESLLRARQELEAILQRPDVRQLPCVRRALGENRAILGKKPERRERAGKVDSLGMAGLSLLPRWTAKGCCLYVRVNLPPLANGPRRMVALRAGLVDQITSTAFNYNVRLGQALRDWVLKKAEAGDMKAIAGIHAHGIPEEVHMAAGRAPMPRVNFAALKRKYGRKR